MFLDDFELNDHDMGNPDMDFSTMDPIHSRDEDFALSNTFESHNDFDNPSKGEYGPSEPDSFLDESYGLDTGEGPWNVEETPNLEFESDYQAPAFMGKDTLPPNANSDGYISDGKITLERTISGRTETFRKFEKDGIDYVLNHGRYIKLTGNTVTIDGVKYDVP